MNNPYLINPKVHSRRLWMIRIEDETGDSRYLNENPIIGTYDETVSIAENMADVWENKTGGLVLRLTLESQGKA